MLLFHESFPYSFLKWANLISMVSMSAAVSLIPSLNPFLFSVLIG